MKTLVGLFSLAMFSSTALAQNQKPALSKPPDYSFTISTERVWTDTGLDLEPGDRVHVYGEAGPILASPDADMPIIENSRLYLGVNGWHCHGTVAAKVHVNWHQPKPAK